MKNLVIIISILVMFSSCAKEQIVHNRFVVLGDYTFEVLNGPDENGDMKVKIVNRKDSLFSCIQSYKDKDAIFRPAHGEMSSINLMFEFTQKTITINKTSGLSIYSESRKKTPTKDIKIPFDLPLDTPREIEPPTGNVFESATNFFNIY